MNSIKRSITECSSYIIYNFSGIELNNEVSRITSILIIIISLFTQNNTDNTVVIQVRKKKTH